VVRPGRDTRGFEDVTITEEIPIKEYLARTSVSSIVFKTPAIYSCLGWKLGEFTALGKAIQSTPPLRALPAPLEHGKHWHLVDDFENSIETSVRELLANPDYRASLEHNARTYYDTWLAPQVVIKRVLQAATANRTPM